MWIFSTHGFFSAVCARKGNGRHGQPIDPDRIMVCARIRSHLEALKKRFPDLLGEIEIDESAGTDYAFRIFINKPIWSEIVSGLAEETNYDNFKSEVARYQGRKGEAYEHSLHEVWSVMNRLQNPDIKITWREWDQLQLPSGFGHGVVFCDSEIKDRNESTVAFLDGFAWLDALSLEVVIDCIKPNTHTSEAVLRSMKKRIQEILANRRLIEEFLEDPQFPNHQITSRINAKVNG